MNRKVICIFMVCIMIMMCACSGNKDIDSSQDQEYRIAMITDSGDITDRSFNQSTYEAVNDFCTENNIKFTYKKPAGENTSDRIAAIESAIDEGYNIMVMPGYVFGGTIARISKKYKDVKFIALDVSKGDILETGVPIKGETYDYNPSNWNVKDYYYSDNVYTVIYQEEICGYMAGYAAVKFGYRKLGFLGGMSVPSVIRFGYGYIQGADAAATELGVKVSMKYSYANSFISDAETTAAMDTWYAQGTEIVFACGGTLFNSVGEAASKKGRKLIGVDVDQKEIIDSMYGEGITVTSAMKGIYITTYDSLKDIVLNNNWENYSGQIATLGLVSGTDPEKNYAQLPMNSTQWNEGFTKEDYKALVKNLFEGQIKVSADLTKEPVTENVQVEWLGNLK